MKSSTRLKLIENATELFANKGFSSVTVREISERSQINISAVYYYFNSKGDLYNEILEQQTSLVVEALQLVKNNMSLSPQERVLEYIKKIAAISKKHPYFNRIITMEIVNPTEYRRKTIEKIFSQLYYLVDESIEEGIAKGIFRTDLDKKCAIIYLIDILQGSYGYELYMHMQKDLFKTECFEHEYMMSIFEIYLNGIVK